MPGFSQFKQAAWTGVVLPIILAVFSTFSPVLLRAFLLAATVVAITWTFYLTEYGARNLKKTAIAGGASIVLAIALFFGGRFMDSYGRPLVPSLIQKAVDSDCSNVIAGGDIRINCPSMEKDSAQPKR